MQPKKRYISKLAVFDASLTLYLNIQVSILEFSKIVTIEIILKNLKQFNDKDVIHFIMEGDADKLPLQFLANLKRFIMNDKFEKEIVSLLIHSTHFKIVC